MQISYNWLLNYLPQPIEINELSNILTSIGLEVEAVEKAEKIPGGLERIVIGEVLTCVPHPNAEKLKQTTVSIGNNTILPIVCGAPNVAAGQKVVVATVGATLYPSKGEPFKIKKAKIRGEESKGMICAEDEIGLGESHDGIMILPEHVVPGTSAKAYFNIGEADYTIHIGLTPNRSDGNSHIGVAKDVCAYQTHHTGNTWQVAYPDNTLIANTEQLPIEISIEAHDACPRYAGLVLNNVKVGASPEWLVQHLQTIGVRSINNIVDITNFVLHEYGQPLHAFDYSKITDHKVIVRYAKDDTVFLALDEKERKLRSTDLMIDNAQNHMCIAGVFGGLNSGITDQTTTIFLESAYFQPKVIRRTSMHFGLRTDAATHFEKGVDIEMVIPALKRAAKLITELTGATIASDITDLYAQPLVATEISVSYNYITNLSGKNYGVNSVKTILSALGFGIKEATDTHLTVTVPSNKPDVKQGADLVEEILRIDGLDNIAIPNQIALSLQTRKAPATRKWKERIAQFLSNNGLQEIVTNSITNSKYYPNYQGLVHMINNLSSELDIMRPEMLESGLEVIAYNVNRKAQDLKLYEFGNTYKMQEVGQYQQTEKLAIWVTGNTSNKHWQKDSQKSDVFYIKGIVEGIFQLCGIKKLQIQATEENVAWRRGKQTLATINEVTAEKLKSFDIKQHVFYAEIDIVAITEAAETVKVRYSELPKYPMMKRDLALVLDKSVAYEKVASIAQGQKWEALKSYDLFDIFESEKLGADKKSLALSFTFQLNDRTLTDEEVDSMMTKLSEQYKKELNAQIRE